LDLEISSVAYPHYKKQKLSYFLVINPCILWWSFKVPTIDPQQTIHIANTIPRQAQALQPKWGEAHRAVRPHSQQDDAIHSPALFKLFLMSSHNYDKKLAILFVSFHALPPHGK